MAGMSSSWNYSTSSSGPLMGPLTAAYQNALKASNSTYSKVLAGYTQVASQYRSDRAAALGMFDATEQKVNAQLASMGLAEKQDIADQYARNTGAAKQSLIDKGLGNTTVQSSVQRGLDYDKAKAEVALTGALAGVKASALQNIGLAKGGGALSSAGTLAGIMAQGYGVFAQGAGQRAGLASSYMNQLRQSHSMSMGGSQHTQSDPLHMGGGGRGGGLGGGQIGAAYGQAPYAPYSLAEMRGGGFGPGLPTVGGGGGGGGASPYDVWSPSTPNANYERFSAGPGAGSSNPYDPYGTGYQWGGNDGGTVLGGDWGDYGGDWGV